MSRAESRELEEILHRLAQARADEAAWSALYDRMWPYIFGILFRGLGGKSQAAEDLSQEVFLRLVRYGRFERLREAAEFRGYLRRIATNLAITHLKREVARQETDAESVQPTPAGVGESADPSRAAEVRDSLDQALHELSRGDRELVELLAEGLTLSEIAQRLGIRYEAAGVRVHRLRRRLRRHPLLHEARENG